MQLKTQWISDDKFVILKNNKIVAEPKVKYFKERSRFLQNGGNAKTKNIFGMVNNISNGCFRGLTGYDKCEVPCYNKCYANESVYALKNRYNGFDICKNGVDNDFFHIYLPENDNYTLNTLKFWRIGSESSDCSLALSLGIFEPWVKNNPKKFFTGINSDYFFVPAKTLKNIAKYDNVVIGHTISVWFGKDDLENRFLQIERYQKYGVPTSVWFVTKEEWTSEFKEKQDKLIERMLSLVSPQQIIEVPFHEKRHHETAHFRLNPDGVCCETGKCSGCKILCGMRYLRSIKKGK